MKKPTKIQADLLLLSVAFILPKHFPSPWVIMGASLAAIGILLVELKNEQQAS